MEERFFCYYLYACTWCRNRAKPNYLNHIVFFAFHEILPCSSTWKTMGCGILMVFHMVENGENLKDKQRKQYYGWSGRMSAHVITAHDIKACLSVWVTGKKSVPIQIHVRRTWTEVFMFYVWSNRHGQLLERSAIVASYIGAGRHSAVQYHAMRAVHGWAQKPTYNNGITAGFETGCDVG